MVARRGAGIVMLGAAALFAVGMIGAVPPAIAAGDEDSELGRMIAEGIRAGGPFFTAPERVAIERKCGYAPGSWDGFKFNMSHGVFHCTNGRELDDPEIRAIMAAAGPRISARVNAMMSRPEMVEAIERVAEKAEAAALRELREKGIR